jgi:hypothetical protein
MKASSARQREELYKLGVAAKAQSLLPQIDPATAVEFKYSTLEVAKAFENGSFDFTDIDFTICGINCGPAEVVAEVARLLPA